MALEHFRDLPEQQSAFRIRLRRLLLQFVVQLAERDLVVGARKQRRPQAVAAFVLRPAREHAGGGDRVAQRVVFGGDRQTEFFVRIRTLRDAREHLACVVAAARFAQLARAQQRDARLLREAAHDLVDDPVGKLYDELKQESSKPDSERRLLLGQIAEMLERHDEALQWYRSVPGGDARWVARLRAANVLHELGRKPEAYEALRGLEGDATVDEETRRDAYLLEAELRQRDDQPVQELDAFARGLAAYPDDPALLYSRALGYERRDDIPRAEADFRRILVAEPDNVNALNALGYTLADRTTRYAEALALIDRARAAEPGNAAIIDSYGWVLYRLGRNAEALVELRRAFALQKDPEIAAHLGEVLWVMDQKDEARRYFDEARRLDPDNRALKRALDKTGAGVAGAQEKTDA